MSLKIVIDIETLPDQSGGAVDRIMENMTVKAPDVTKPILLQELALGPDGKYKTVPELKEMWLDRFGETAARDQANDKWLKTSFDGTYGEICAICVDIYGIDGNEKLRFFVEEGWNEEEMLRNFWDEIFVRCKRKDLETVKPFFIAHNAKFDLPFLYKRSVINEIYPRVRFNPHGRHGIDHYCTSEAWAGFGNRISLNNLAKALDLGSKTEGMDGSQVWPEFQKGNIDKIVSYCEDDVELTRKVYERLAFL